MSDSIIVALITGGFTLVGTILAILKTNNKTQNEMRESNAVLHSEVRELTREVREHNNFARRMPVVEEQVKVINHRISDLENEMKSHHH